jgi:hypothetical protein
MTVQQPTKKRKPLKKGETALMTFELVAEGVKAQEMSLSV